MKRTQNEIIDIYVAQYPHLRALAARRNDPRSLKILGDNMAMLAYPPNISGLEALEVSSIGYNSTAVALGKLAKGKPKTMTSAKLAANRANAKLGGRPANGWVVGKVAVGRELKSSVGDIQVERGIVTSIERKGRRMIATTSTGHRQGFGDGKSKVWTRDPKKG